MTEPAIKLPVEILYVWNERERFVQIRHVSPDLISIVAQWSLGGLAEHSPVWESIMGTAKQITTMLNNYGRMMEALENLLVLSRKSGLKHLVDVAQAALEQAQIKEG